METLTHNDSVSRMMRQNLNFPYHNPKITENLKKGIECSENLLPIVEIFITCHIKRVVYELDFKMTK